MNKKTILFALSAVAASLFAVAGAQNRSTPQARSGTAETRLVGISLFDTGKRVISMYGSPYEVQALTVGGTGVGPTGTQQSGRGAPGGAGTVGGGPGGGGGGATASALGVGPAVPGLIGDPFDQGSFNQNRATGEFGVDGGGNVPTAAGAAGGAGGGPSAAGAPGGAGGGGSATGGQLVTYTRWVYKRKSSRYAFVLDKFNRVIQIEAVGANDGKVRTRRGVGFGNTFGTLIARYNAPDGYEINGDTMVVRFLNRDRVAFRLQRLRPDAAQVVTGVVVAAGK